MTGSIYLLWKEPAYVALSVMVEKKVTGLCIIDANDTGTCIIDTLLFKGES